jgi:hypothetical protein
LSFSGMCKYLPDTLEANTDMHNFSEFHKYD